LRAVVWVDVLVFFAGATGGVVVAEKELEPIRVSIAVRDRNEYRIPEYVFIVRPTAETLARAMARLRASGGATGTFILYYSDIPSQFFFANLDDEIPL